MRITTDTLYSDTYSDLYGSSEVLLIAFQVAFTTAPGSSSPVWVDLGSRVDTFSIRRGRQRTLEKFTPGRLTISLKNDDRYLDPLYSAGPYFGYLKPLRKCRLTAEYEGTLYYLFTGYVDGWPQSYRKGATGSSYVDIGATDGFKVLAGKDLPSSVYEYEVRADSPAEWFRFSGASGASSATGSITGMTATTTGEVSMGASGLVAQDADAAASYDGTSGYHKTTALLNLTSGSTWCIEAIIRPDALRAGNNYICGVGEKRNNTAHLLITSTGKLRCTIGNGSWAASPESATGSTTLEADTTYHVAARYSGGTLTVYVNGASDGAAALVGTPVANDYVWIGARPSDPTEGFEGTIDEVAFYAAAPSAARLDAHYAAMSAPWDGDASGARVGKVLDLVDWPSADRHLDTGISTLQATALATSALEYAQKVEETENGSLYMTGQGKVRFRERHAALKSPHNTSQATFGDGAGELGYHDIVINHDDAQVRNLARITRDGGVTQQASDATSIDDYFERTFERTGQLHDSDTESLSAAEWIVAHFKDAVVRVDSLVLRPGRAPATLYPQALGREMGDRVTVKRRPQAVGSAISTDVLVEGITHDVDVSSQMWQTTWNLSAAEAQAYWLLGDATYSLLDTSTRVAY